MRGRRKRGRKAPRETLDQPRMATCLLIFGACKDTGGTHACPPFVKVREWLFGPSFQNLRSPKRVSARIWFASGCHHVDISLQSTEAFMYFLLLLLVLVPPASRLPPRSPPPLLVSSSSSSPPPLLLSSVFPSLSFFSSFRFIFVSPSTCTRRTIPPLFPHPVAEVDCARKAECPMLPL